LECVLLKEFTVVLRRISQLALSLALAGQALCAPSFGQSVPGLPSLKPRPDVWVPDEEVTRITPLGSTLYLSGTFEHLGPCTGAMALIDTTTGLAKDDWFRLAGTVKCTIPDGNGGYFVGGQFSAGAWTTTTRSLIHVLASGALDAWDPKISGGIVETMLLDGNTLYIGGVFNQIAGVTRRNLAALNSRSAALLPWNPITQGSWNSSEPILALAKIGTTLFFGGKFNQPVSTASRRNIAAVSTVTGALLPFNPSPDYMVTSIVPDGNTLILGGDFTEVDGASRRRIARVGAGTGNVSSWYPGSGATGGFNSTVWSIARSGNTLYVGGNFSEAAGTPRGRGAALDMTTAALLDWDPQATADPSGSRINTISIQDSWVVLGGRFQAIRGVPRRNIAWVRRYGESLPAEPLDIRCDIAGPATDEVFALGGDSLVTVAGGYFSVAGALPRFGNAAIDLVTGKPTSFQPLFTDNNGLPIPAGLVSDGTHLYAAGKFHKVNGVARSLLARLDGVTGQLDLGFVPQFQATPHPTAHGAGDVVARPETNQLYVIGSLPSGIPGVSAHHLNCLDLDTGDLRLDFANSMNLPPLNCIELSRDHTKLYLGASNSSPFEHGAQPVGVAMISAQDGSFDPVFDPPFFQMTRIYDIQMRDGDLYVAGAFKVLSPGLREAIARFDPATGTPIAWAGSGATGGTPTTVTSMAFRGNFLLVGGNHWQLDGIGLPGISGWNLSTSQLLTWNPESKSINKVLFVENHFVAGGRLDFFGKYYQPNFAVFTIATP